MLSLLAIVAFTAPLLLAGGCVKSEPKLGGAYYKAVPKSVHEGKFPHGHADSRDQNCIYDERDATYFCQYD